MPNHFYKNEAGEWIEESQILDERYLACRIKGRGLVVFSACSHAGIVNILNHAKEELKTPLTAVFGGLHLSGTLYESRIDATVRDLRQFEPELLVVGHCTGWKAKAKLQRTFEHMYQPLSVGGTYTIYSSSKKRTGKAAAAAANKKLRKERSEPTRAEGVPKRGRLEYFKGEEGTRMRLEGSHISGSSADKKSCVMCYYEVMRKGVIARQPAKSNNFCKTCGVYLCRSAFSGQQKSCFDKFHSQTDIERVKRDVVQPKQGKGKSGADHDDGIKEEDDAKDGVIDDEPDEGEEEVKMKEEEKENDDKEEEKEDSKPAAKTDAAADEKTDENDAEKAEEKTDGNAEAKTEGKPKAAAKADAKETKKTKDKEEDEEEDKKKNQRPRRTKTQIMSV
jgi:hypothetical protein